MIDETLARLQCQKRILEHDRRVSELRQKSAIERWRSFEHVGHRVSLFARLESRHASAAVTSVYIEDCLRPGIYAILDPHKKHLCNFMVGYLPTHPTISAKEEVEWWHEEATAVGDLLERTGPTATLLGFIQFDGPVRDGYYTAADLQDHVTPLCAITLSSEAHKPFL